MDVTRCLHELACGKGGKLPEWVEGASDQELQPLNSKSVRIYLVHTVLARTNPRCHPWEIFWSSSEDYCQDRLVFGMVRRGRRRSAVSLRYEWRNDLERPVSRVTVKWRLLERVYQARRPLRFARQHRNLTVHHWHHVVFGNESRFLLHRVDGRVRVRWVRGEALCNDCVIFNQTGGGGSVYVWRVFHRGGALNLVVLDRNVTRPVLVVEGTLGT